MKIDRHTTIEDLVDQVPDSVQYLMKKGIKCIACGEPIWGTLEDAAKQKGFSDEDIKGFVNDLNDLNENPSRKDQTQTHMETKKLDTDNTP